MSPLYEGVGATQRVTPTDLPEYRLPFDRNRIPKRCTNCKSGMLELDQEHKEHGPARLICVLCSEVLGKVHL